MPRSNKSRLSFIGDENMELTVYRQSEKDRKDANGVDYKVYKGEDARPLVGDNYLCVADGMGGASSIKHRKFKRGLFNKKQLPEILFKGVIANINDPVISRYIKSSFFEFWAIRDRYFDNSNNIKQGGYFASRIVSCIFLNEILYNNAFNIEKIFNEYNSLSDLKRRQKYLQSKGCQLKDIIAKKLKLAAKNGNFIYESTMSNLSLLGTTLCATIFVENDDFVEAIYFTAGDSRPYMWDKDGLHQVVADQEREDGGMTNFINANEDAEFTVECCYKKIAKPCILFNATDGCFDVYRFREFSQLAFEQLLLECIIKSKDIKEVKDKLTAFFVEEGKGEDDSSTMALKVFGYDSFEQLKEAAEIRYQDIQTEYLDKMPDLLEVQYTKKQEDYQRTFVQEEEDKIADKLRVQVPIIDLCKAGILDVTSSDGLAVSYRQKLENIDADIMKIRQDNRIREAKVRDIIAKNYLLFLDYFHIGYSDNKDVRNIKKNFETYKQQRSPEQVFQRIQKKYEPDVLEIEELVNIYKNSLLDEISRLDSAKRNRKSKSCTRILKGVMEFLIDCSKEKAKTKKALNDFYEQNRRKASRESEQMNVLFAQVLKRIGNIDFAKVIVDIADRESFDFLIRNILVNIGRAKRMQTASKDDLLKVYYEKYFTKHIHNIITLVASDDTIKIADDLREEIRDFADKFAEDWESLVAHQRQQALLFDQYDEVYYSMIRQVEELTEPTIEEIVVKGNEALMEEEQVTNEDKELAINKQKR